MKLLLVIISLTSFVVSFPLDEARQKPNEENFESRNVYILQTPEETIFGVVPVEEQRAVVARSFVPAGQENLWPEKQELTPDLFGGEISRSDDELLQPAATMVFRPLFRYKKQTSNRRRVYYDGYNRRQATSPPRRRIKDRNTNRYVPDYIANAEFMHVP